MLKKIVQWLLKLLYRVEIKGLENYHKAGERVLVVANHSAFLDPPLLWAFLPDDLTFAINTHIAKRRWIRPFLGLSRVFVLDPTHPLSLKDLIHHLKANNKTVLFPEGRITVTGSLMKIYDGTGMVADRADATILPIRIDGAEFTHFSRLKKVVRLRWFPKIIVHILPPQHIKVPEHLRGRKRRQFSGQQLTDIMTEMMVTTSPYRQTLFSSLLAARKIHGGRHPVAEDVDRIRLSYNTVITRSIAIGNALCGLTESGENVGVMLPNSSKTLNVVLGLQLYGRVPAMLNFSTGSAGMISSCRSAQVKTVLTSRKFIELGKLEEEAKLLAQQVKLVYLEDLAKNISALEKLKAYIQCLSADYWYRHDQFNPDSPAVVLFTSGSEGTPKGVVLSHANLQANHKQIAARISFNAQDVVFNFLPMFHSFGFTVGTLLPLFYGMTTFYYPTPLHYSVIPEIAYETNASIMFGTNTFFAAYGKKAHPYDFYKMRYVIAGAEKLQDNTRELWMEKFGIRILEGYGATETSPVTSVNTPINYKKGTVGRIMPTMQYRLEEVPGIEDAGQLHVSGPNIMLGYLLADNPGKLVPPESKYGKGWYDTGDIVQVDELGYISIRGRSKRFAKISGEMISLTATEQIITAIWPAEQHAVVSLPDERKGEKLILLTTRQEASSKELLAKAHGVKPINLPRKIIVVDKIPLLATGKTNYPEATELAAKQIG